MAHVLDDPGKNAQARGEGAAPARDGAPGYDAFISYSQRADRATAQALRTVIQTIGKPWWQVRGLHVFLDATSLSAAPGLWQSIEEKLDRSRYLMLLASPAAAQSHWVNKEVDHFVGSDGAGVDRLLIGLTEGELVWDPAAGDFVWSEATPLPPSLRGRFREEPLWVDLRPFRDDPSRATKSDQAFLHAALDLAATIKGVEKADLYSEELRRQRRSLRMAYGIAAVVAVLGIGAGIAAWVAVEQEARATSNLAIARDTVERVVFDVAQGLRQVEGMRIESVRTILTSVESAVDGLVAAAPEDKNVQRSRASMLQNVGDTYATAGDGPAAQSAFEEAIAISRSLLRAEPDNALWQYDLTLSLERLAAAKVRAGDSSGARAAFDECLSLRRHLVAVYPERAEFQAGMAACLQGIGDLGIQSGDAAASLAAYQEALAIFRKLTVAEPDNTRWQGDVLLTIGRIGDLKMRSGDHTGALAAYEESLAVARTLSATDVTNTVWQGSVSLALERIADLKMYSGDLDGVLVTYEEILAIWRRLAATDEANVAWQRNIAVILEKIGQVKMQSGDVAGGIALHEEGLEVTRRLAEMDPSNTGWQHDIWASLGQVGYAKFYSGDIAGALVAYQEALDIIRTLTRADADNAQWQTDMSVTISRIGGLKLRAGEGTDALAAYEEALAISRRLARSNPDHLEWQRDVSAITLDVGKARFATGDIDGALAAYQECVAIRRGLVEIDPENTQWREDLTKALGAPAFRSLLAGRPALAESTSREAISIAPGKKWLETNLAHALMLLDRTEEADAIYLANRGQTVLGKLWETAVLDDFSELRAKGIAHPHMDEIAQEFASAGELQLDALPDQTE